MKNYTTKINKTDKQNLNILYLAIVVVFISKYFFEAGIAVGKMFCRLMIQ